MRLLTCLVLLTIGVFSGGCVTAPHYSVEESAWLTMLEDSAVDAELLKTARKSPRVLFERGLANYRENIKDYRCKLRRIERLNGAMTPEQQIDVQFLREPFSVYLRWTQNAKAVEKALYVEGQRGNKMLALPVLVGWLTGAIEVDPKGKDAMKNTRKPITEFGFGQMLERMVGGYRNAGLSGGDHFRERLVGPVDVAGRKALAIERVRVKDVTQVENQPVGWRICLDVYNFMPIAVTEFGADKSILGEYIFSEINYNVGLTPENFLPSVVGLGK